MSFGGKKIKEGLANLGAGFSHAEGNKFVNQSFDFTRCTTYGTFAPDEKSPSIQRWRAYQTMSTNF